MARVSQVMTGVLTLVGVAYVCFGTTSVTNAPVQGSSVVKTYGDYSLDVFQNPLVLSTAYYTFYSMLQAGDDTGEPPKCGVSECGTSCGSGTTCQQTSCGATCQSGNSCFLTDCGGTCAQGTSCKTATDCGNTCKTGSSCDLTTCGQTCSAGGSCSLTVCGQTGNCGKTYCGQTNMPTPQHEQQEYEEQDQQAP